MYEDYMQNLIGGPFRQYQNTYDEQDFNPYWNYYNEDYRGRQFQNQMSCDELESCYPEIYNIVYPMVRKACMSNTMPITQTVIDNMVNLQRKCSHYNEVIESYKKCNEKCKTCTGAGDDKCIECNTNYEFKNDFENDAKCYEKCMYNYYYDQNNIYK